MPAWQADEIFLSARSTKKAVPVWPVYEGALLDHPALSKSASRWVKASGFEGKSGQVSLVPDDEGALCLVLFGLGLEGEGAPPLHLAGLLPDLLPAGIFEFEGPFAGAFEAALSFGLGAYQFLDYKSEAGKGRPLLKLDKDIDEAALFNIVSSVYLGRSLINTPANDLGPSQFEAAIKTFAGQHKAKMKVVRGEALLAENFPMVHAVGRAATDAPRLVELNWGKASHPAITLVGKGICYDTGGLNLKPGNAMNLMKKDMGGAATALTIASMVMGANLPVKLRVLLPIAENNISGNSFRPGDVLKSRKGITVEIENTDAEGRLVLADALALASEKPGDLILCFATLTGAARVALGPDLPPFYTDDEGLATGLLAAAESTRDYCWRMPFWRPYDKWLNSKIADVNHISSGPFAGSITAALFLRRFVAADIPFAHFDIYGWSPEKQAGRPFGGEPQTARAVFHYLSEIYG